MTNMPPPPSMPYQPGMPQSMRQPAQTNVAAIVSLVCGIIGCLMITSIVAIVCGIVGIIQARTLKTGRGMAIAGILLAVLWLAVGVAGIGGVMYVGKHGSTILNNVIGESTKPAITSVLNNLADGDTAAAKAAVPGLTDADAAAMSAKLKDMGHVKNLVFNTSASDFTNGVAKFTYGGTASFDNGSKPFDVDVTAAQNVVTVNRIGIK